MEDTCPSFLGVIGLLSLTLLSLQWSSYSLKSSSSSDGLCSSLGSQGYGSGSISLLKSLSSFSPCLIFKNSLTALAVANALRLGLPSCCRDVRMPKVTLLSRCLVASSPAACPDDAMAPSTSVALILLWTLCGLFCGVVFLLKPPTSCRLLQGLGMVVAVG